MAKVNTLSAGSNPPEGEKWVLVTRDEAVRAAGVNITQHDEGATFAVGPHDDAGAAPDQARAWADKNGIAIVYVRL